MLEDKEFLKQIKEGRLELPKSSKPEVMLEYIDNNPKSLFVKYANKFEKITMLNEEVRDPRAYINMKKLAEFRNDIEAFAKKAIGTSSGAKMVDKFAKRAKVVKYVVEHIFNICSHFPDSRALYFRFFFQYGVSRFDKLIFLKESRF